MGESEKYLFVDEHLQILTGREAAEALKYRSDAGFLDPDLGVVAVPRTRWEQAQRYERDTWLIENRAAVEDRNEDHSDGFAGYEVLSGRRFAHAIELGCGPFTNLRVLARTCGIDRCTLLDPLIDEYLSHPHCTYDRHALRVGETRLGQRLGASLPGRVFRRALQHTVPSAVVERVPVNALLPLPIEEMPTASQYDLCVMINVLEHCYDAERIFDKVAAILEPGGIFVFHDKAFTAAEAAADVRTRFDAGHPLRVGLSLIEPFLERCFRQMYRAGGSVIDIAGEIDLTREGIYFIGQRV